MRTFIATALLAVVYAEVIPESEHRFMRYIAKFNKDYSTVEEYALRFARWLEVDAFIDEVNAPDSVHTHSAIHNKFSDWSEEEFSKMLNEVEASSEEYFSEPTLTETASPPLGATKNWADGNCVNAVKDQGSCGSCWSFAATACNESSFCIDTGTLNVLSEQQLVDCDTYDSGCSGGLAFNVWKYYTPTHGQEASTSYGSYTARNGTCTYKSSAGLVGTDPANPMFQVSGNAGSSSSTNMMAAIDIKPTGVSINASSLVFQTYSGGVITSSTCASGTTTNHAVTMTGYDSGATDPYYIVRNSWGSSWGNAGYVNIGQSDTYPGICAINKRVGYPNTVAWGV